MGDDLHVGFGVLPHMVAETFSSDSGGGESVRLTRCQTCTHVFDIPVCPVESLFEFGFVFLTSSMDEDIISETPRVHLSLSNGDDLWSHEIGYHHHG